MNEKRPDFKGNYPHSLDDKGRLTLPSPLREELFHSSVLSDRLYLNGFPANKHLTLYTFEMWNQASENWSRDDSYPNSVVKDAAKRLFFANVEMVNLDKAGRILIPTSYREKIGVDLGQKIIVNGVGDRIELWSPADYETNQLSDLEIWRAAQELEKRRSEENGAPAFRLPLC
jgi:MraZ protein